MPMRSPQIQQNIQVIFSNSRNRFSLRGVYLSHFIPKLICPFKKDAIV